jgi:hypothetical protein
MVKEAMLLATTYSEGRRQGKKKGGRSARRSRWPLTLQRELIVRHVLLEK